MRVSLVILTGIATVYAGEFVGEPLFCDCTGTLRYDEFSPPWVALPVEMYGEWAECGDEILLTGDGWRMKARALDAGPLSDYYIADFPEFSIVADVPAPHCPFVGLSARARMINVSRVKEWMAKNR